MYVLELAGQDDEFAAYEARSGASDVSLRAPGLATARGIESEVSDLESEVSGLESEVSDLESERSALDGVETLAFTHRASELLGTSDPEIPAARALLQAASLDREGTVAVRAVDVRSTSGVDTQAAERELGAVLVDRGFTVDLDEPDHELRALFADGESGSLCALGWLATESTRDYGARRPSDRPFFQPGSMDPMLARALANVAGAGPGRTILDPMCGTGGILIEAALVGARVVGLDVQKKMLRGSGQNLAAYLSGGWNLLQGTASSLPLADDAVDGVVFDTPYGRQSKIEGELEALVEGTLQEAARVAPRCVVVGDRPWVDQAESAGWTVEARFERHVHRSLTRHVLALTR